MIDNQRRQLETARIDLPAQVNASTSLARVRVEDLRSQDTSAARDRAQHRRSFWLYEDLLA